MKNIHATVAALCIFNGLGISPVQESPRPRRWKLAMPPVAPRFEQCERYLSRFFNDQSTGTDYSPLEVFKDTMAVSAWIRAAVGHLQYSFKQDGISLPNPQDVHPSLWFSDLEGIALIFNEIANPEQPASIYALASRVQDLWELDTSPTSHGETRRLYAQTLYGQFDYMKERDQLLISAPAIIRERAKVIV